MAIDLLSDEILKVNKSIFRRDMKVIITVAVMCLLLLISLVALDIRLQYQLQSQIASNRSQSSDSQAHQVALLAAVEQQGETETADIQCIATLFTEHPASAITVLDLTTCQTTAQTATTSADLKDGNAAGNASTTTGSGSQGATPTPPPAPSPSPTPTPVKTGNGLVNFIKNLL